MGVLMLYQAILALLLKIISIAQSYLPLHNEQTNQSFQTFPHQTIRQGRKVF